MPSTPLPDNREEQQSLFDQVSVADVVSRATLATLKEIEEFPERLVPARIQFFLDTVSICQVLNGASQINASMQESARHVVPLLEHLGLSSGDEKRIRSLVPSNTTHSDTFSDSTSSHDNLLLGGMVEVIDDNDSPPTVADPTNNLRIQVLLDLLERVSKATTALSRRLNIKLHPPSVSERMQVDDSKGLVIVDDAEYHVRDQEAVLFKHLREANGKPVSGPEIAKKEDLKEFKAGRIRNGIKQQDLKDIIKQEDKKNGRFFIELPELEA